MAKICINPNCGKEIPSSATFCLFCGRQQVEDVQLSEEEKLRKEINEQQETIALLRKALADAQQNSKSLIEQNQKIENQKNKLKEIEEKEKRTIEKNIKPNPGPISLYAGCIKNGLRGNYFYNVKDIPDEDTVFELKLQNESVATVTLYIQACNKILSNPSLLEGCNKKISGNSTIRILAEGEAQRLEPNNFWLLVIRPDILIF
jgi:hypothetical protein